MKRITIAIDGRSSCGKSTLAKDLAKRLGYSYVDTGAMYRAVALYAMRNNILVDQVVDEPALAEHLDKIKISFNYNNETGKSEVFLNGENVEEEIRQMPVSNNVSFISKIKMVREKMVEQQRRMGMEKGVVMDGRDIGTAVFPDAELKIYLDAEERVRVKRRYDELLRKGITNVTEEEVKQNQRMRDLEDMNREDNPLKQADDAIKLDNTELTMDEQFKIAEGWALEIIES